MSTHQKATDKAGGDRGRTWDRGIALEQALQNGACRCQRETDRTHADCVAEAYELIDEQTRNGDLPSWTKPCQRCGTEVARWWGQGDVSCPACGAWYNAGGQRLRDDWTGNPAWDQDNLQELDDLEGFERQQLAQEDGW